MMSDDQSPQNLSFQNDYIEADIDKNASNVGAANDNIQVGDIVNSEAVAIGRGAIATSIRNFFFGERDDVIHQRNHWAMRQLVKSNWIDGVFKHSLYNEVLIRLHLEKRPDAVENPYKNFAHVGN